MRRHLYIAILIAIVTTLILTQPIQSVPPTPSPSYCIAGLNACESGGTEDACEEMFNIQTDNLLTSYLWKAPNTPVSQDFAEAYNLYCDIGCCQLSSGNQEIQESACVEQGGTWYEDSCPEVQPEPCGGPEDPCPVEPTEPGEEYEIPDTCGNGGWDFPGEQCDGANIGICGDITPEGVQASCTNTCQCAYNPGDYNPEYCHPGNPACAPSTCEEGLEFTAVTSRTITGTNQARITWSITIPPSCDTSEARFDVFANTETFGTSTRNIPITEREALITLEGDRQEYDVFVRLTEHNIDSQHITITHTSGDEICFTPSRNVCTGSGIIECDQNNFGTLDEDCPHCYQTIDGQGYPQAACGPIAPCELCNAAYHNFGEVRGEERVQLDDGSTPICANLISQPLSQGDTDIQAALCRLEYTNTSLQEYVACQPTKGCLQYQTEDSCGDNVCGAQGTCEWNNEHGLCTAQEIEHQICDASSRSVCEAQGDACSWVSSGQGGTCQQHDGTCAAYGTNEDACIGGVQFLLDPNTNVETFSNDALGLGKCKFGTQGNQPISVCYKDANDDGVQDSGSPTDFTNPVTSLITPTSQIWGSDIAVEFSVDETARTYANLTAGPCTPEGMVRPTRTHTSMMLFNDIETGTYCLQYYSRDTARNMEHVKQANIIVDTEHFAITDVEAILVQGPLMPDGTQTTSLRALAHTNREAFCSIELEQRTPEQRILDYDLPSSGPGTTFEIVWHGLFDGEYVINTTCRLPFQQAIDNFTTVHINSDGRMAHSSPNSGWYRNEGLDNLTVHVNASFDASCYFMRGTERTDLERRAQPRTIDSVLYYAHTAPIPLLSQGIHTLQPLCEFVDGSTLAPPALARVLRIDEQPPTTIANVTIDGEEFTIPPGNVPVGEQGREVRFSCAKQPIAPNVVLDGGCTLYIGLNGEDREEHTGTIIMEEGDIASVHSVDRLGNTETPQTFTAVNIDISGPQLECFWIEEDSAGTESVQCD